MKKLFFITLLIGVSFAAGFILRGGKDVPIAHVDTHQGGQDMETPGAEKSRIWTCSMHPQIRLADPGQCPICGMDLIPASEETSGDQVGSRELLLSPGAIKRAQIQTAPVERKFVSAEISLVGKVDYDETRLANITAWVPGRIDRMFVDYTGVTVKKGDHMVDLYSPDLLTAQEELIQARKTVKELEKSGSRSVTNMAAETLKAVRKKLRLLGLTKNQINSIEQKGNPSDHITIYSPVSGIVIHKEAVKGMYVNTGSKIYTIADLSHVWVKLDAYESDLVWIRYGQEVEFKTEAYPGEIFKGRISFIDPVLNAKTRTVKVRVNVPNSDGKLKPEMFVQALVRPRVAAGGKVIDANLAGKWISPMHPEIVKDEPGYCDICGMPLVRAETLGYVTEESEEYGAPLVIPASAPLITGKRAVVYVALPEKPGAFQGREIILGPRAGDYYHVREGLKEGELVVVNGNFKIDSAVQILAKPSMMNPEGGGASPGHAHHQDMATLESSKKNGSIHEKKEHKRRFQTPLKFRNQIDSVLRSYFKIQEALNKDNAKSVTEEGLGLEKAIGNVDMKLLQGQVHTAWMDVLKSLLKQTNSIKKTGDITKQREAFFLLSETLTDVVKRFGAGGSEPVLRYHCPMAFGGKGAHWLQNKSGTANPYFGQSMSKCGDQTDVLVPIK
ncbi:MAG: efflux RND transporter periplasmic adaptor subunit [Desulfatiglans sp.]|nr:efflux RND transporter periplasmic adaptor subunit [Desulfatiglans sp.]